MTNFNHQLTNYDGKPSIQKEKHTDDKKKITFTEHPLTLRRCAYYALLDIAEFPDGFATKMTGEYHQKRYHLMQKIDADPENVTITAEEKEILSTLLPLRYDVVAVGQIMDLL